MEKYLDYLWPFLLSLILAVFFTLIVQRIAKYFKIVDQPEAAPERKIHTRAIPLLGGTAIILALLFVCLIFKDKIAVGFLLPKYLWGIFLAGVLLMIGGFLDDKYNLSWKKQIIWPILAVLVVIAAGIGVKFITNPFGGVIWLDQLKIKILTLGSIPYYLTLFADLFAFVWLLGMMYTTKYLDGLDGLVSGITVIGAVIVFFMSLSKDVSQPQTAMVAAILAGSCLGFLIFNFNPARIFLGEGGSLFCGFMLGILAIIGQGKIATALLIMGIPILDVAWVIIRRLFFEKKSPFQTSDKKHLHFRLLDVGFSHRGAVIFLYFLTVAFGSCTLFFRGIHKLYALLILGTVMVILGIILVIIYRRKQVLTSFRKNDKIL